MFAIKDHGSFTGIRIGIATAKAFSDSLGIKTIGISSLEALAYGEKNVKKICSMIDAKNDNIYVGMFEKIENTYVLKENLRTESIFTYLEELKINENSITFIGSGAIKYKEEIKKIFPKCQFVNENNLSAFYLGIAGYNHYLEGKNDDILPLYLRKTQAEMNKSKQ